MPDLLLAFNGFVAALRHLFIWRPKHRGTWRVCCRTCGCETGITTRDTAAWLADYHQYLTSHPTTIREE